LHKTFEFVVNACVLQVPFDNVKSYKVVFGQIDPILFEINRYVLPMIRKLKRSANLIRPEMALLVSISEQQQNQPADWIRGPPAIID